MLSTPSEFTTPMKAQKEYPGQISYQQVYRLIRRGNLPAVQPAGKFGRLAIRRADLEKFLEPLQPAGNIEAGR